MPAKTIKPVDSKYPTTITTYAEEHNLSPEEVSEFMLYNRQRVPLFDDELAQEVEFIPGHVIGGNDYVEEYGPPKTNPSRVMIISKMPGIEASSTGNHMSGPVGDILKETFRQEGIDYRGWYVTTVCRFSPPAILGDYKPTAVKNSWIKECQWFLDEEIKRINPEFILILGADALKGVFGTKAKLKEYRGDVDVKYKGIRVMTTIHPGAILKEPSFISGFQNDMARFAKVLNGNKTAETGTTDYVVIDTLDKLREVVDDCIQRGCTRFAVDTETGSLNGGKSSGPFNGGGVRLLQFSVETGKAFVVKLYNQGMTPCFTPSPESAVPELRRLFERPEVKVAGHNFRYDLRYIKNMGIDMLPAFLRGFDTMLAHHLLYPHENQGLEILSCKYTNLGRYDRRLADWIVENHYSSDKLKKNAYGEIPEDILVPYSAKDVDVVIQAWPILEAALKANNLGPTYGPYSFGGVELRTQYDFYTEFIHAAQAPLHEIEMTGLLTDTHRLETLSRIFMQKKQQLKDEFSALIKWPDFNFRSAIQVRELLFGIVKKPGDKPTRPEGAVCFNLTPIKTTGKPSKDWGAVPEHEKSKVSASTDAETLQILAHKTPMVSKLMNLKFIDQMVKNFLRPPESIAAGEEPEEEEEDDSIWAEKEGLLGFVDLDSRTRTSLSQLTDTGRYRSSRPNLNNLPKKQETHLRKLFSQDPEALMKIDGWAGKPEEELKKMGLLHPDYYNLRSCYLAKEGYVFVEADYVSAELWVLAYLSGDADLQATLKDPKRDIHSEQAAKGFGLPCEPSEVKKKYPHMRNVAKAVIYGLIYGRGAKAIVRETERAGQSCTEAQAQAVIQSFLDSYPRLKAFMNSCITAMNTVGYIENPFGRRRYFFQSDQWDVNANMERQSINSPIQSTVAELLTRSLINLYYYREVDKTLDYRIVLPIHDAIMLEVREDQAEKVAHEVLPLCMTKMNMVPYINLQVPTDAKIMKRWMDEE